MTRRRVVGQCEKNKNKMKQLGIEWTTVGWNHVQDTFKRDGIRRINITIKISKQIASRIGTNIDFSQAHWLDERQFRYGNRNRIIINDYCSSGRVSGP